MTLIGELQAILDDPAKVLEVIRASNWWRSETRFGDDVRTEIVASVDDIDVEDLIVEETRSSPCPIQATSSGTPQPSTEASAAVARAKWEWPRRKRTSCENASSHQRTHHYILIFSTQGRVYWLKVYQIPQRAGPPRARPS
jgi:DNA gyrase subunit A